jgi:hypothetical protein
VPLSNALFEYWFILLCSFCREGHRETDAPAATRRTVVSPILGPSATTLTQLTTPGVKVRLSAARRLTALNAAGVPEGALREDSAPTLCGHILPLAARQRQPA